MAVTRGDRERRTHKALIHAGKPENGKLVLEALQKAGRMDLADRLLRSGAPPGHHAQRACGVDYHGPAFLPGLDQVIEDDHDGHFPAPAPSREISWQGRKRTATIKPLRHASGLRPARSR